MKRAIALLLVLELCISLCACGGKNGPNGSYSSYIAGIKFATLTFKGNKVLYETDDKETEGTFVMDGNTVKISYENGNSDQFTYDPESDTLDFMGLMTFTKD